MTLLNNIHHHNSINSNSQHHHHHNHSHSLSQSHDSQTFQSLPTSPTSPTTQIPRPTTATSPIRSSAINANVGPLDISFKAEPLPATLNSFSAFGSTPSLRSLTFDDSPSYSNSASVSGSGSENPSSKASIIIPSTSINNNPTVLPKPLLLSTRAQSHTNFLRKNASQHTLPDLVHKVTDLFTGGSNRSQTDLAMSPKQSLSNKSSTPSTSRNNSSLSLNRIMESFHGSHTMNRQNNNSQSSTVTSSTTTIPSIPTTLKSQKSQQSFRLKSHGSNYRSVQMSTSSSVSSAVKETHYVHVDYDPVTRKRVLNTYEILKDLGAGQHGKVKLGKDIDSHELVAIKIVDRKSRPRLGRLTKPGSTQEDKIRREIAIMKKCDHPNVVKLIEVLDADNSRKIYLVLEYLEKGEIKWQKKDDETLDKPEPLLTYDQCRFVFRDIVSGLEYLHNQGIIHRDIKPSNLLVSEDNVVKISDFGVSFAANLDGNNEFELAKTAGTPAFLAPELCRTEITGPEVKVTHKIDIWALGVTLYCLLFGTLPFNAESEFGLFESINNDDFDYPDSRDWKIATTITESQLEIAKDIINKLLKKNPADRIGISDIKNHPFFAEGLSRTESKKYTTNWDKCMKIDVSKKDVDEAVVGIGNRIRKKLSDVFKFSSSSNNGANSQRKHTSNDSSRRQSALMDHHLIMHNRDSSSSSTITPTSDFETSDRSNVSFLLSEANGSLSRFQPNSPQATSNSTFNSSGQRFLRRSSLAPSIESSDTTLSSTASLNDETVSADSLIQNPNNRKSSAQFQLAEILTNDSNSIMSTINNSPTGFINASVPLGLTDVEADENNIGESPNSDTGFPSNNESIATLNTLKESVVGIPTQFDSEHPSQMDETELLDERPLSPYDYRKDLTEFSAPKTDIKVAPSFASLDSFYDNDYANGNLRYNPYTGFISSDVPNQRQGSKGSNGYSNSVHSIPSSAHAGSVSIKSPGLNPAVNRYPSLSSSAESRQRIMPLTTLSSINKDIRTTNGFNNNNNGSYSSRDNSNPLPLNASLHSAVSIPDFLKNSEFGDPLTPFASNKNNIPNNNAGNYYATGSINTASMGISSTQPPIRQPAALSNDYRSPITSPPLQPRTSTPSILNKSLLQKQLQQKQKQEQQSRRGRAIFANESSSDDEGDDEDDGPITFKKSVFAQSNSPSDLKSELTARNIPSPQENVTKNSIYGRKIRMGSGSGSSGQMFSLDGDNNAAAKYTYDGHNNYFGSDSEDATDSDGSELLLSFDRGSRSRFTGFTSSPPGRGTTLSTTVSTIDNNSNSR